MNTRSQKIMKNRHHKSSKIIGSPINSINITKRDRKKTQRIKSTKEGKRKTTRRKDNGIRRANKTNPIKITKGNTKRISKARNIEKYLFLCITLPVYFTLFIFQA